MFLLQVREEQDLDDFSTHSASIRVAVLLTSEISSPYTECGLRGDNTSGVSPGLRRVSHTTVRLLESNTFFMFSGIK